MVETSYNYQLLSCYMFAQESITPLIRSSWYIVQRLLDKVIRVPQKNTTNALMYIAGVKLPTLPFVVIGADGHADYHGPHRRGVS